MAEERLVLLNLAAITRRHLFAAARSMLDEGHYGPAVVVVQAAVEVGMETAISFGLRAGAGLHGEGQETIGVHDLRHSLVANAFEHGADHREVAELARHANAKVTLSMYGGLTADGRGRAVAKLVEGGFGT